MAIDTGISMKAEARTPETRGTFAQRRPLTTFLLFAFGIGVPLLSVPVFVDVPGEPFLLVLVYIGLLLPALLVTRLAAGRGAIKRMLGRTLIWKFSVARWAVIVFAMPALTLALAAGTGTLASPEGGWAPVAGTYLFATFIFGALILNMWEELAWGGFVQSRLMARHGLLMGALLTAPLFAAIHIPLHFHGDWTWSEAGVGLAVLFAAAPFYRYLVGMHLLDTRGSILAIGIQHASWNAAGNLEGVDGDWQAPAAAILLTALVAVGRRLWRSESRPVGRDAEQAAAAGWLAPESASNARI